MNIQLDGDGVAELASAAIFQSLSEEARETVLKQAVQALLTPERDRHMGSLGKTPLQNAFEQAIREAAYKAVREAIAENPEVRARIDELMGPLIRGVVEEQSKGYNDELADAIGRAIGSWLAEKARGD